MKFNQDNIKSKKSHQNFSLIIAQKDATDFNSLVDYLNNHQHELKSTLTNYGAIVIRGYQVKTPEQFQQVGLSLFPNLQNQYPGGAPRQKVAEYVWTASELPSYLPISGHTELSYSPSDKPTHILFFCPQVAASGGETPVIDMKSVLSDLPARLKHRCSQTCLAIKLFWVSTQKSLFDVRLWKWPWFRSLKSWQVVYNTEDRDVVETKCHDAGRKVEFEWLTNDDLIASYSMPIISPHPITKELTWTGWFPRFHIWGSCIEAWFVSKYQRKFRSWLVFFILFLITFVQACLEKLIPGDQKYRVLDVTFEDGSSLSVWDVYHIVNSYWQNSEMLSWQEGDILILDNYRMGHGRLPFTGDRRVYTAFAQERY